MELLQGDCMELLQDIPDGKVDLVLCDLPYGTTDCKWDKVLQMPELWAQYKRVLKPGGVAALFSAQPFTTTLINSNRKNFKYCWYWAKNNKTGFAFAKYQPMRRMEDICIFYSQRPTYNPQGLRPTSGKRKKHKAPAERGNSIYKMTTLDKEYTPKYTGYPSNLLHFDAERGLHPTQKPVPLLEYLIKTYTNPGETVLDNCMGSGSTAVACLRTGRHFIGIEREPEYYKTALQRIRDEQDSRQTH